MSGIWQRAQAIEREAIAAVTRHHYDHPYPQEATMPTTLADAIHAELSTAIDNAVRRIAADVIDRYLGDPHNLLGALADVLDGHGQPTPAVQPQLPALPDVEPSVVQAADPDADPAA